MESQKQLRILGTMPKAGGVMQHRLERRSTVINRQVDNHAFSLYSQSRISVMDDLHWRDLYAKTPAISCRDIAFLTCLGHLGWRDTDRIISICVATLKVATRHVQKCRCHVSLSLALSRHFCQCEHRLNHLDTQYHNQPQISIYSIDSCDNKLKTRGWLSCKKL